MAEGGLESEAYLRYAAEDSGNVAADGMFSSQARSRPSTLSRLLAGVARPPRRPPQRPARPAALQVLSKALEVWGLTCPSLDSPDVRALRQQPELADAFICNLQVRPSHPPWLAALIHSQAEADSVCVQEHWCAPLLQHGRRRYRAAGLTYCCRFTIRKVAGQYWNFNSLFPAPQPLSNVCARLVPMCLPRLCPQLAWHGHSLQQGRRAQSSTAGLCAGGPLGRQGTA